MRNKIIAAVLITVLTIPLYSCVRRNAASNNLGIINNITTSDTYPIKTDAKITWWVHLHALVSNSYKSLNDTPFAQALRSQTGVDIEFIHPPQYEEQERFELMLASGTMADIVEINWNNSYSGGVSHAISDGVIIKLNDILEKVSPNFKGYLEENPNIARGVKTPEGDYAYYPFLRGDKRLNTFRGFMVRTDLMEQVGVGEMPATVAEFEALLYKFRDAGVEIPLSVVLDYLVSNGQNPLMGAFGIDGGFYLEDGIVKYGPYQPRFQEFIKLMARWYADGIFDKSFTDNDTKRLGEDVSAGKVGAVYASAGGHFGAWIPSLKANIPSADMQPMPYLVLSKGERPQFGQYSAEIDGHGAAITRNCKNVEVAARLLDFGYSKAGHDLYNFGIEGISYRLADNIPTYSELVTDPGKNGGVPIGEGIAKYARAAYFGPFVQNYNYITQYYQLQQQKDALHIWSDTDAYKHKMPNMILTKEESGEYTRIMSDVFAAQNELVAKYINGQLDASNMETFYFELAALDIERAVKIQQEAYDRYINQ